MQPTRTLEELRSMVHYVIDTKDETLIDNYVERLRILALDFDADVRHTRPTIEFNGKRYYGKNLVVKDNKAFIDGFEIESDEIEFSGNVNISNNQIGSRAIRIIGDLTANEINCNSLFCDDLKAETITTQNIHADNINANTITAEVIKCDNVRSETIKTNILSCDGVVCKNQIEKNIS